MRNPMFQAKMTPRPAGKQIGWVALELNGFHKEYVKCPSVSMRDSLWNTGRYEWIRGLFHDGEKYWIQA